MPNSRVMTQLPYTSGRKLETIVAEVEDGLTFSYPKFGSGLTNFPTGPLGRFTVNFPNITETDFGTLQAFVGGTAVGMLNEFAFLDPGGNLVQFSELLSDGSWIHSGAAISATGQTDPYGGSRATSYGGAVTLKTSVLPDGFGNSFLFNASIFAKGTGSATLLLTDNTTTFATQVTPLSSGWKRCEVAATVTGNNPVFASFSFSGAVTVFGAQCVPTGGPGAYRKTPGAYGLHKKCRLDSDDFAWKNLQFNSIAVSVNIVEYF